MKNRALLLKSSILEHTRKTNKLQNIYTIEGERGTSPSRNGNFTIYVIYDLFITYFLMSIILKYIDIQIENNNSHLNDTI